MIWREDTYKVTKCSETSQAITCKVTCIPLQMQFLVTFVYAHNVKEEMGELWDYFRAAYRANWAVFYS